MSFFRELAYGPSGVVGHVWKRPGKGGELVLNGAAVFLLQTVVSYNLSSNAEFVLTKSFRQAALGSSTVRTVRETSVI